MAHKFCDVGNEGVAVVELHAPGRRFGNDDGLKRQAESNILKIAAGHTFLILFREAYPINVINNVRNVSEVATIYCATSNPVQVIVAKAETNRSYRYRRWALTACNRKRGRQGEQVKALERPRLQKMTRRCVLRAALLCARGTKRRPHI
jgi:Adenosine specific kinase